MHHPHVEHPVDYPFHPERVHGEPGSAAERARRETYLDELSDTLALSADGLLADPRVSERFESWTEWQTSAGELPPDYERLPARGALPDPLERATMDGWTTVDDRETWAAQRERIAGQLQYWVYGSLPPAPATVTAETAERDSVDGTTAIDVTVQFGPDDQLSMGVELLVPPGDGPFPVMVTQWNHRKWAEAAVQRGYLAAVYAGADTRDDTTAYASAYPDCSFQVLARRAWGASRVLDYLLERDDVDPDRIGITGHSRNGKQSLLAAAFDDRFDAVVVSSAGSGAVVPARLDRDDYHAGDMSYHARLRRSWFHPRWRFFVGREHRLPVDANSLISLVAPRACTLFTATNELTGNSFGIERAYASANGVYEFLDVDAQLGVVYRPGDHGTATRDLETIMDCFDAAFDPGAALPVERYHPSGYNGPDRTRSWTVGEFPARKLDRLLTASDGSPISSPEDWAAARPGIRERIQWGLGTAPASVPDPADGDPVTPGYGGQDHVGRVIGRPEATDRRGRRFLSPYQTPGKPFGGHLFYPRSGPDAEPTGEIPAVVWLHPFAYNAGYGNDGRRHVPVRHAIDRELALFTYDQLGCGTRLPEGRAFYDRYPEWSKMGKLVADARAAVRTVKAVPFVDPERVCVLGYSLGGTVGLYAGAMDEEIPAVASVCGVPPLRAADPATERASATIARLAEFHGLQPRLGPFRDAPERIPFDFHEVMGLLAPRPQLVVAPTHDWTHPSEPVQSRIGAAESVYELFGASERFEGRTPDDILSFDYHEARLQAGCQRSGAESPIGTPRRDAVFDWIAETLA